ncbi:hypothetical protein AM571_PA00288 (plasmid) [Rhizobium etli 8C-3]|uniref:Tryptophan 2-monooxygenase n=1 Tax=Rhizobium etli 8C-3 TaxID=538025 RepID=A0A1L5PAH1_RHIET|nr:FAD-dependent oxidoreductase [Rhizobium etli]APO77171.1 hypothetical protein AM571_PA00288 [Rhizobium etli 8C-3]
MATADDQYSQASADFPLMRTDKWTEACGGPDGAHGAYPFDTQVLIIGAGFTGVTTGEKALNCGGNVTILEASSEVGGRLASQTHDNGMPTHLAAMRFGKGMKELQDLVARDGYTLTSTPFMNTDAVPTLLYIDGQLHYMDVEKDIIPDIIKKPRAAFAAYDQGPLTVNGTTLVAPAELRTLFRENDNPLALQAHQQLWAYQQAGLTIHQWFVKVFHENNTPPGGIRLTKDECNILSKLYPTGDHTVFHDNISAFEDQKWNTNGSTVNQGYFSVLKDGKPLLGDVGAYIRDRSAKLQERGVQVHCGHTVTKIEEIAAKDGRRRYRVRAGTSEGEKVFEAHYVFATPTLPAMVDMGLAAPGQTLIHPKVAEALTKVSTTPTSKYEWTIPADRAQNWVGKGLARNIQGKSPLCPCYIMIEEQPDGSQKIKVHFYAWNTDAERLASMGGDEVVRKNLIRMMASLLRDFKDPLGNDYTGFHTLLVSDSKVYSAVWQDKKYFGGGWTFPQAGEEYAAYLIQRNLEHEEYGVGLIGSAASGADAWILRGVQNAKMAIERSLRFTGGKVNHPNLAPIAFMGPPIKFPMELMNMN